MKKDFLSVADIDEKELSGLILLAKKLKALSKAGSEVRCLAGKSVGMIFRKSSTRTHVSFEVGIHQLGGQPLFLSTNDLQIGRGEPIVDTANVLSRYLDGIMIRTYAQAEVEELAKCASVPVINGLTDYEHPCQIMADLMTIDERLGTLAGKKLAFIGDGNNVANSLIFGCLKAGMSISVACPKGYEPHENALEFAKAYGDKFTITNDTLEAASGADVVYTDVWASIGQEAEAVKRKEAFAGYQVNAALLSKAKPGAMVQHCLPAHRGEEITADVFLEHAKEIYDEAENRLHMQKAIMAVLMGGAKLS